MEVIALLQARREGLWGEREATAKRIAKIQARMEDEAAREGEPAYPDAEMVERARETRWTG